jgi:hypothetical protein
MERTSQQTELRVGRKTHVRAKLQIAGPSNNVLAVRVVEMSVDNLLGEGRWSLQSREACQLRPGAQGRYKMYLSRTMARLSSMHW